MITVKFVSFRYARGVIYLIFDIERTRPISIDDLTGKQIINVITKLFITLCAHINIFFFFSNVLRFMPEDLVRISFVINSQIDNGAQFLWSKTHFQIARVSLAVPMNKNKKKKTKLCEWTYHSDAVCIANVNIRWFHRWRHKIVLKYK